MGDEDCHQDHIQDHHSAAIELSNSCRKFYFNHVKTTEEFKKSVCRSRRRASKPNGTVKSRLDAAMDKLRTEMAELMDQDLSLMEQLLTLNDRIEEVKHKYMYSVSKDSLGASSCNLSAYCDLTDSDFSIASLDVNDYNEDCLFGSDMDIRDKGVTETDDVFVGIDNNRESHKNMLAVPNQNIAGNDHIYVDMDNDLVPAKNKLQEKKEAFNFAADSDKSRGLLSESTAKLNGQALYKDISSQNLSQEIKQIPRHRSEGFSVSTLESTLSGKELVAEFSETKFKSCNAGHAVDDTDVTENCDNNGNLQTDGFKGNQEIPESSTPKEIINANRIPKIVVKDFVANTSAIEKSKKREKWDSGSLRKSVNDSGTEGAIASGQIGWSSYSHLQINQIEDL